MVDVGYISNGGAIVSGSVASQMLSSVSAKSVETDRISPVEAISQVDIVLPRVRVDVDVDVAILEYVSLKTGEVQRQYPSEEQIRAFQDAERIRVANEAQTEASSDSSQSVAYDGASVKSYTDSSIVKTSDVSSSVASSSYAASMSIDTSGFGSVQSTNTTSSMLV